MGRKKLKNILILLSILALLFMGIVMILCVVPVTKPLVVKLSESLPFVNIGDVTNKCLLAASEDNKKQEVVAGNAITFTCILTNSSKTDYKGLTLKINIARDDIHRIRDLKGTTGYIANDNNIVFENVLLPAKGKSEISFVANANFSNKDDELIITPELKKQNIVLAKADQAQIRVTKSTKMQSSMPTIIKKVE